MKHILILLVFFVAFYYGNAQVSDTVAFVNFTAADTAEVIRIAKANKAWFQNVHYFAPKISYDPDYNHWRVECLEVSHTKEGMCAHTNGCSAHRSVIIYIEWEYKTIVRRIEDRTLHPNYE